MKSIIGALLLSLGIYCFGFGLHVSVRFLELQRLDTARKIVYPENIGSPQNPSPIQRHSVGLFLVFATGTTIGLSSGLHLLLSDRNFKFKKTKWKRRHNSGPRA